MQGRFTVPFPTATPRACTVCERPLDALAALAPRKAGGASASTAYPLCRELACRWIFEQIEDLPEAEFRRQLHQRAQTWRATRKQLDTRAGLLRERAEAEGRENAAAFAAIGSRRAGGPPQDLELVVPSGHGRSRLLSERRRQAHAAHLDAIIAAALNAAETPAAAIGPALAPDAGAARSRLPGRLCGACGGGCCASGGVSAYLTETTIRRVMAADPGRDPAQLRAIYLGHLAQRTVAGSCVHHTRHGCSLPRSLRSDVCNNYVCDTLARLQRGLEADPPVRTVAVVRRRQNRWNQANLKLNNDIVGGAVLTEATTTRLRPPKTGDRTADDAETRVPA